MNNEIPTILTKIVTHKLGEISHNKELLAINEIEKLLGFEEKPVRPFLKAIEEKKKNKKAGVIAEIKKASPSKGVIRQNFCPEIIAESYETSGATCLSVLTDSKFFQGSNNDLKEARAACSLPVLRKDFILDMYQVYESRLIGADCILLIASILSDDDLKKMSEKAADLGMDALIEVHNKEELNRALEISNPLIGINNRNLHTFEVSLDTTLELYSMISANNKLVVTESGINKKQDVVMMIESNIYTFLVGEAFMRAQLPGDALSKLFSNYL